MTDPGLNDRLRQRSRRAGLMVGLTMALTILICVGGFAAIYAGLVPFLSDFVPAQRTEARPPATRIVAQNAGQPTVTPQPAAPPEVAAPPAVTEPVPEPTATQEAFEPTHQSNSAQSINFRSSPEVTSDNSNLLYALPPATPLQYLDEDAPTANSAQDGRRWMRFRNERGDEGWIREIDSEPYRE